MYLIILFLATFTFVSSQEAEGICAFIDAFPKLSNLTNGQWTKDQCSSPCSFYGVTCENTEVIALNLSSLSLSGNIPKELGLLVNLQILDLSTNNISGQLPQLTNLTKLEKLFLQNNDFVYNTMLEYAVFNGTLNIDGNEKLKCAPLIRWPTKSLNSGYNRFCNCISPIVGALHSVCQSQCDYWCKIDYNTNAPNGKCFPKIRSIEPRLHCVEPLNNNLYRAYFGYSNPVGTSIPAESITNKISGYASLSNNITSFETGIHVSAFSATFEKEMQWDLDGNVVDAKTNSPSCGSSVELSFYIVSTTDKNDKWNKTDVELETKNYIISSLPNIDYDIYVQLKDYPMYSYIDLNRDYNSFPRCDSYLLAYQLGFIIETAPKIQGGPKRSAYEALTVMKNAFANKNSTLLQTYSIQFKNTTIIPNVFGSEIQLVGSTGTIKLFDLSLLIFVIIYLLTI